MFRLEPNLRNSDRKGAGSLQILFSFMFLGEGRDVDFTNGVMEGDDQYGLYF